MTNADLAKKYADGAKKGTVGNMYIKGDTIYSYGSHFPISRKLDGRGDNIPETVTFNGKPVALFTSQDYSVTTARHKSHVFSALKQAGYELIEVSDVSDPGREIVLFSFESQAIAKLEQYDRSRNKDSYLLQAYDNLERQALIARAVLLM